METFDLGIAWNWEPDTDFVKELNDCALKEGLKPYLIHAYNFYTSLKDISEENIRIRFFLDRTISDTSPLSKVGDFLHRKGVAFINPEKAKKSLKTSVKNAHHNILLPMKILLEPRESVEALKTKLGYMTVPFVLKPLEGPPDAEANTRATSIDDLLKLKQRYGDVAYAAQEKILPAVLGQRHASFRCVYCCGEAICSWWYPEEGVYEILTEEDIDKFELNQLLLICGQIAGISKLDFFLTGIVMDGKSNFFVTDYADVCPDMRRKSKFNNGVPDAVVDRTIKSIVRFVKRNIK